MLLSDRPWSERHEYQCRTPLTLLFSICHNEVSFGSSRQNVQIVGRSIRPVRWRSSLGMVTSKRPRNRVPPGFLVIPEFSEPVETSSRSVA